MNSTFDTRSTLSAHFSDDLPSDDHFHLSEDQVDDQLLGDLAAEPAAHLASCCQCAQRVRLAAFPIDNFSDVTMAWSERRSATLPLPDLAARRPLWQRHMTSAMACFTFVLGFALINASHEVTSKATDLQPAMQPALRASSLPTILPAPVFNPAASARTAPPKAQVSADNQMLQAVDTELDASAESPAALGLEPVSAPAPRPFNPVSVQD